jgi:tetratricopeptide (TPR) repeat protein
METIEPMLKKFTHAAVIVCALLLASSAALPSPQEAAEKKPKDMAEYELLSKTFKEIDPATKLQLLSEWKEKYPESEFKEDRLRLFMRTHQQAGDNEATISGAKDVLAEYPGDFEANFIIATVTPSLGSTDAVVLATGEKAASSIISTGQPSTLTDDQWGQVKGQVLTASHQTLGWIHMQRKDNVKAEGEFKEVLDMSPNVAQVSYWLGNVVSAQGDPDKVELALFCFARAATYTGEGALAEAGRNQVDEYLTNIYVKFTGTEEGLDELKAVAMTQPLPPANLVIESASIREFKAEERLRDANPLVYVFNDLRDTLKGPNGDATWGDLQAKLTPKMALYLLGSDSARPSVLNLGSSADGELEVVLNLENRLRAAPAHGSKIQFEGVASRLTKEPFRLTLTAGKIL